MTPELLPGAIIALPFLAAAILRIPGLNRQRVFVDTIAITATAGTTLLAALAYGHATHAPIVHWVGGWALHQDMVAGIALVSDSIAAGFIFLTAALTTAAQLFMIRRYKAMDSLLHILTLIFLGAFCGFVMAGDLLTMFVFLELMGLSSYILTAFKIQDDAPVQAAFNIGIVATTGAFIFLMGVAIIYKLAGTPNIAEAADRLTLSPASPALVVAIALLLGGLAVKASLFPFHFAHADSHTVAPAPHAGLFGAILMQVCLYGIARLGSILLDTAALNSAAYQHMFIIMGIATALIGAVMSVVQNNLKRLLSFSGIAHIGIAAVGVGLFNINGLTGAAYYITGHAAVKMSLFLVAGVILHRFDSVHTINLAGAGRKSWLMPFMLIIGALALAGAPPSGLYGGKVFIEEGLKEAGMGWIIYLLYLAAALTGAALFRFTLRMIRHPSNKIEKEPVYIKEGSSETSEKGGLLLMTSIPVVLMVAGVLMPFIPQLTSGFSTAAEHDFNRIRYVEVVLKGESIQAIHSAPHNLWKAQDLAKGITSGLVAVLIGLIAGNRFITYIHENKGLLGLVRTLHSGHVGDYLSWLLLGLALMSAWLLWQL